MKQQKSTLKSLDDANKALLELGKTEVKLKQKEAEFNKHKLNLEKDFERVVKVDMARQMALTSDLKLFAEENKKLIGKSKKLFFGALKFKMNPGKIETLNKLWVWKNITKTVQQLFPGYIRDKPELNKEKLLEAYAAGLIGDIELASVGLRVNKEDQFSYSINYKAIEDNGTK